MLVCSIIRRASVVLSGGSASARSLNTSTSCPPSPKSSTGPNCGSGALPMISSFPPREIIGWTETPRKCPLPAFSFTEDSIAR